MHVYFTKAGKGRWGWGVGVKGHAHRYVLILPAKRVFLFFGVKASLGDDSSSQKKKKKIRTYYLSQQIHCSNGAFSISNETSPHEFVPRPICAVALCIPTVYRFTFFFFFSASKKNCHRHETDLVTYYLYL